MREKGFNGEDYFEEKQEKDKKIRSVSFHGRIAYPYVALANLKYNIRKSRLISYKISTGSTSTIIFMSFGSLIFDKNDVTNPCPRSLSLFFIKI